MAATFKKIYKNLLRNDAHFQFHTEFKDVVSAAAGAAQVQQIEPLWARYKQFYAVEDEGLKKIRKSALTVQIQDADKARDEIFSGMAEQVRSLRKHFDAAKRDAAARLKIVFDTYGDVAGKTLNEETSAIYNFLQDILGPRYHADTIAAGLFEWAEELRARNAAFDALIKRRDNEASIMTDVNLKEARADLDAAYDEIAAIIEAHVLLRTDSAAVLDGVITAFNPVIERFVKLLGRRKGRGSSVGAEGPDADVEE